MILGKDIVVLTVEDVVNLCHLIPCTGKDLKRYAKEGTLDTLTRLKDMLREYRRSET